MVTSASIKAESKHGPIMPVSRICHLKVNSSKLYVLQIAFNQIVTFDAWKKKKEKKERFCQGLNMGILVAGILFTDVKS